MEKLQVLIIDDDQEIAEFFRTVLTLEDMSCDIVLSAKDALKHLTASVPDLILLDLNLPRKDGFEVLKEVKEHRDLSSVPVVILTSSQADRDILKSYNLHANCFISKPLDVDEFLATVRSTGEFWLSIVRLPPAERPTQPILAPAP